MVPESWRDRWKSRWPKRIRAGKPNCGTTIEALEKEVATLKQKRKEVPSHLTLGELPPAERFQQFSRAKKHLVDTIKMVAYRAETALAMSLRQHMPEPTMRGRCCARSLSPRQIFAG